jgi:predicted RNase H-like HicB family nuclease
MQKVINVKLSVSVMREGDSFIAYTPTLDLSTCGKTLEEAKIRFSEAVQIFFEELSKNKNTEDVLIDLGWKKNEEGPVSWQPPVLVEHNIQDIKIPA